MTEKEQETKQKPRKARSTPKKEDVVIPLRRPYMPLVLGLLLFGAGAFFFYHEASTNVRGLIINGLIHLDPDGADIFYAVMAVLSGVMSAGSAFGIWRWSQKKPFHLVLSEKSILMPSGPALRPTDSRVFYRDIHAVELFPPAPAKPVRLVVHAKTGVFGVLASWMPSEHGLRELSELLVSRIRVREGDEMPKAASPDGSHS